MNKKIVFVTNSLGFGGAEKMLTFVANELSKRGNDCIIINLNRFSTYVNEKMQNVDKNIKVINLKNIKQNKNVYYIKKIIEVSKKFNADVLIGFTAFPNMYVRVASFFLRVPSIISERGDPTRTKGDNKIKTYISDKIINSSKGAVFQTPGAMGYYGKGLKKRGIVISNPIFINEELSNVDYQTKEIISIGRFDNEQKRYDVMINAFKIFYKSHPEYVLKLYGSGPDEKLIKELIEKYSLENRILIMGVSKNPLKDLSRGGMFVISSDYEGISNALLEAMAVGLPCISTDHTPGGGRFLIKDHENGLLVPINDAVSLSKAMNEFANDKELAKRCGENAQKVLKRFEPNLIINMWDKYIEKVCEYND